MAKPVGFLRFLALPLCLLMCALITVNVVQFDYQSEISEQVKTVSETRFIANDGFDTPTQSGYGPTVELPHSWYTDYEQHVGWYTTLISVSSIPDRPQAIYFPDVSVDSTVFLNDQILGSVLMPSETRGKMGRRPLFIRVPVGLWLQGDNELNIRVNAQPNSAEWMREFYVGAETDLSDVYAEHVFHSLSVVKIIAGLLAFTAVSMGTVWLFRPKDAVYGWFAVVCTAWSGVTFAEVTDAVFFDITLPAWAGSLLFLGLSVAILKFVDETRVHRQLTHYKAYLIVVLVVLSAVALYLWKDQATTHLWVKGIGIVLLLYACAMSIFSKLQIGRIDKWVLWLTIFMLALLSVNAWLSSLRVPGLAFTGLSTATAAPAFVFLVGYQLIRDFVTARNELEDLNQSLELRVVERTSELQKQHQQLIMLERTNVLSAERDRIMLEMHDGMGAHLVSILSMTDRDKVNVCELQGCVRDALQDLRMMIDSLDPVENDLGLVLGMYRHRMGKLLRDSSISLKWEVTDLPEIQNLTPHRVLQILRILQEAVANAIKYAETDCITISTGIERGRPYIQVKDHGKGMSPECVGTGRGLHNMQKRAKTLNADMVIVSGTRGVSVRLVLASVSGFSEHNNRETALA